jgi:glycosyltransferase involved in cell wall biosynthesis
VSVRLSPPAVRRDGLPDRLGRMRTAARDFSVVIGCYNAAGSLEAKLRGLVAFLDGLGRSYEVVIVEDGSRDMSLEILRRLERELPQLAVLHNPKNMGKGFSIRNGILNSSGRYLLFTDMDMVYAMDNLRAALAALESGASIVVGNRRLPASIYTVNNALVRYVYRRHQLGAAFNRLVRLLFGITTRDTQSGLKGFRREAAVLIFDRLYTDGFLFDVEIFVRSRRLDIPVVEIPVHLIYDSDESTVSQMREFLALVPELLRIKALELGGAYDDPPVPRS